MATVTTQKLKRLGIGAEFYKPGYNIDSGTQKEAVYRIIGRAAESATQGGHKEYMVKAVHVPQPGETNTQESKFFNIDFDVVQVAKGRKISDAIDMRDQPDDVETLAEVAAREGVKIESEDD